MIFFVRDLRMICAERRLCTNFKQSQDILSSPLEEKLVQIGILCMEDAGRMLMHTKLKLCSRFCVVVCEWQQISGEFTARRHFRRCEQ